MCLQLHRPTIIRMAGLLPGLTVTAREGRAFKTGPAIPWMGPGVDVAEGLLIPELTEQSMVFDGDGCVCLISGSVKCAHTWLLWPRGMSYSSFELVIYPNFDEPF